MSQFIPRPGVIDISILWFQFRENGVFEIRFCKADTSFIAFL